jgi:RND family efflux transporter MFP subunit
MTRSPRFTVRAAILLVGFTAAAACNRTSTRPAAVEEVTIVPVAAEPAQTGRLRAVVHASGVVTPADRAEFLVVAPEPARILEITKAEGESVAGGEVLVRFEMPSATQEVARQQAEVQRAQVLLESARVAQTRARDLMARGMIPRTDMDVANREFADAEGAVARAEAARRIAEAAAARAIIRAPFAGVVVKRLHQPGDVVQGLVTDPVLRLIDPKRIEITASVPAADVSRVQHGASARLAGGIEGREVPLTVAAPPNPADLSGNGYVRARLTFVTETTLAVDTPVEVDIDAEERRNVVFISPDALVRTATQTAVFVAVGDRAQRRVVTTGVADDQGIEITSGLRSGELVITRGQSGLADGAQVNVALASR